MSGPREYEFSLAIGGVSKLTDEFVDAMFEAGCDDATLSERCGRIYMTFTRLADSYKDAALQAIAEIHGCDLGLTVLRIDECDLVTQAEIARRLDWTRQRLGNYVRGVRGPGHFPSPVCHITDDAPLYYWCEVVQWLLENDIIADPQTVIDAYDVADINHALGIINSRSPDLMAEVRQATSGHSQE